ncbi:MAG: hypothetical protein ACI30A_06310, partial [Paludibacteraceae bacterium]
GLLDIRGCCAFRVANITLTLHWFAPRGRVSKCVLESVGVHYEDYADARCVQYSQGKSTCIAYRQHEDRSRCRVVAVSLPCFCRKSPITDC